MKWPLIFVGVVTASAAVGVTLLHLDNLEYEEWQVAERERVDKAWCVEYGIQHFKDIGSYPRLSDGRSAATVARERCERMPAAFPPVQLYREQSVDAPYAYERPPEPTSITERAPRFLTDEGEEAFKNEIARAVYAKCSRVNRAWREGAEVDARIDGDTVIVRADLPRRNEFADGELLRYRVTVDSPRTMQALSAVSATLCGLKPDEASKL